MKNEAFNRQKKQAAEDIGNLLMRDIIQSSPSLYFFQMVGKAVPGFGHPLD
jgi:hypothetical protein